MDDRPRRLNLALLRRERELGVTRLESLPAEIQIEATNRCDGACSTCARHYYDRAANQPGDLQPAVLDRIAPLFPYAERVLVGGYGEPLLADLTPAIVGRAKGAGCHTTIITRGVELEPVRADALAAAGLDEVLLSLDGADENTLLRRRGVSLREVLANVDRLRAASPRTMLAFNVTLQVDNLGELPAMVELAAAYGAARVAVHHQKIYTRSQAESTVLAIPAHAADVFTTTAEHAARLGVTVELPPLAGERPCEQPYRMLVIRHDGLVQGCCSALFESPLPRVVLGRLPEDNPVELWNAPAMQAARAWTLGRGPEKFPCADCAFRVFTPETHRRYLDEHVDG